LLIVENVIHSLENPNSDKLCEISDPKEEMNSLEDIETYLTISLKSGIGHRPQLVTQIEIFCVKAAAESLKLIIEQRKYDLLELQKMKLQRAEKILEILQ
jgi:hypothetical protein